MGPGLQTFTQNTLAVGRRPLKPVEDLLPTALGLVRGRHSGALKAVSIGFLLLAVKLSEVLGFSLNSTTMILGKVVMSRCTNHGRHIRFTIG